MPQQRCERASWRRRQIQPDLGEHHAHLVQPAVHLAADEQLFGGQAPDLEARAHVGSVGGGQVGVGGLAAAAGVTQRVRQAHLQVSPLLAVGAAQVDGAAVELGGAAKGEGLRGALRGALRLQRRLAGHARGGQVAHHEVRIVERGVGGLEGVGEPRVQAAPVLLVQVREHRFAHPVVVGVDAVVGARAGGAHQHGDAQERRAADDIVALERGGGGGYQEGHGRARHGHDFEQPPGRGIEALDAREEGVVEAQRPRRGHADAGRVLDQLVQEQGWPPASSASAVASMGAWAPSRSKSTAASSRASSGGRRVT